MRCIAEIKVNPNGVLFNDEPLTCYFADGEQHPTGRALLTSLYKQYVGDYPKFYKMDPLARVGFLAAELLLQRIDEAHFVEREDRAVVFVNRSASLAADRKYETTIQTGEDYFPSPADFVYTLPNIVTGEIAIRHHYHGETNFLVVQHYDVAMLQMLISQAMADPQCHSVLGGWVECEDESHFESHLGLYVDED